MTSDLGGAPQTVKRTKITAASTLTEILPSQTQTNVIQPIFICNEHTGTVDVAIYEYDGSTDVCVWVGKMAGKAADPVSEPIIVGKGRSLRATVDVANVVTISATTRAGGLR